MQTIRITEREPTGFSAVIAKTMKYKVTVPPTAEQGSYTTVTSDSYGQTYRARALQDYNSCRAHDGLPPVKRMPAGTTYTPIVEYALQGNYGGRAGWEDLCTEDTRKEARKRLKEYQENEGGNYRIVRRAAVNEQVAAALENGVRVGVMNDGNLIEL